MHSESGAQFKGAIGVNTFKIDTRGLSYRKWIDNRITGYSC